MLLVQIDYWKSILLMIAHLETSSIVGLTEGPLLYLVEIKKKHQKGKGSTFPGLMQMEVQDFC